MSHAGASAGRRPRALLAMSREVAENDFGAYGRTRLAEVADLVPAIVVHDFSEPSFASALAEAEVLVTHWGAPLLDEAALAKVPKLCAVVHVAGSVKGIITEACWERGIVVSSAAWANALPVAEFTLAAIIFANKRILDMRDAYREQRGTQPERVTRRADSGNYRRTIGIVGASNIGRRVLDLVRPLDVDVLLYDPYISGDQAADLGARSVALDELCAESDVVSLHAPALPETRHMLDERRLALIHDGATVINTARGSLIDTEALAVELERGRIHAIIDVAEPEILPADSVLFDLPNVLLTPHIAGSVGTELRRLVDAAADELARYAAGLDFAHPVLRQELKRSA